MRPQADLADCSSLLGRPSLRFHYRLRSQGLDHTVCVCLCASMAMFVCVCASVCLCLNASVPFDYASDVTVFVCLNVWYACIVCFTDIQARNKHQV